ncbi:MAG: carboxypeptidase-like regulatory domain-containing protein [Terriglobales bacterium]
MDVTYKRSFTILLIFLMPCALAAQEVVLHGRVSDPQGNGLPQASVQVVDHGRVLGRTTSETDGSFQVKLAATGEFIVKVEVPGF